MGGGARERAQALGEHMNRITRREILRRLGGLSIVGALGGAVQAVARTGHHESRSMTAAATTRAGSSSTRTPTYESIGTASSTGLSTTEDHAHHGSHAGSEETTEQSSATSDTSAITNSSTSSSDTVGTAGDISTTSAPPQVAVGTLELVGVLGPTTVLAGQVATIVGNIELRGDIVIEGVLTGIDTFTIEGNGYQIEVRKGGQVDLRGIPRSGWVRGASPQGWQGGDRVLSTPSGPGRYSLSDFGSGPGIVSLVDGRTIAAEQFNLTRSIVINNVSRFMFHMGAGRQVLKHLAVTNAGLPGKLAFYPLHFHMNGDSTRGSIVEGVVVENGRFHAFVPHASHGITFLDCVAYNTVGDAYWWDPPPAKGDTSNDSHDTIWQHCLAAYVAPSQGSTDHRLTAFALGAGLGNRCVDSVATCVLGGKNSSGFLWLESDVWEFRGCVSHNNSSDGIFVWTNSPNPHVVDDFIAYDCGRVGIEHGSYNNQFYYRNVSLTGTTTAVQQHALSRPGEPLVFERFVADTSLILDRHRQPSDMPTIHRACTYAGVVYQEKSNSESGVEVFPSHVIHEDGGLLPANFDLTGIHRDSVIEIVERGVLVHRWADRSWT